MKEIETKSNIKKAVLLLTVLSIFGFGCFKLTSQITQKEASLDNPTTCPTTIIDNSSDNLSTYYQLTSENQFQEITPALVIDTDGTVLSTTQGVGGIKCNANNVYQGDDACALGNTADVDYSDATSISGTMVSKTSTIELVEIQAPVRILSGSLTVRDSNRQLTSEDPVYKPAGEQFSDLELQVTAAPGELSQEVEDEIINGSIEQESFATAYSIAYEEQADNPTTGTAVVSSYANNLCEECNNEANDNPDKSNRAAAYLKSIRYSYPNQLKEEEEDTTLTATSTCENLNYLDLQTSDCQVCVDLWKKFVGAITAAFTPDNLNSCNNDDGDCIAAERIIVKMNPIFEETNSYMETRNQVGMDPEEASEYGSTYVTTDCIALIDGTTQVHVKCAWDMSYLLHERQLAEFDDVGGSDTPSEQAYETYLQNQSATRDDPLVSM